MSSARLLFPDFRDEQSDSRYPFVDTATLTATDGVTKILRDTFIDATFFVINGGRQIYIASVVVAPRLITIIFGDENSDNVASAEFVPNPIQAPSTGALNIFDIYGRPAGTIVSATDRLTTFAGWAVGTYDFELEATTFTATTIIPANEPGVRALTAVNSGLITGDVWLIGDGGVVIRHEGVQDDANIIRVDIVGVPLFSRFVCLPFDRFTPKTFVRTINGCEPDQYGNFSITSSDYETEDPVLRITQRDGIIFFDAVGRKVV
jgi:hypothetical protein